MSNQQRVLIVDDDPSIHECVRALLRPLDAELITATTRAAGVAAARLRDVDLVLLDVALPDGTGFELCEQLRADPATTDLPIIFLTAAEDADAKVRAFECGASDYITKPFDVRELRARVRASLRTQSLVDQLETLAYSDGLTGLANRKAFHGAVAREISRAASHTEYGFVVMFIDLDRFKIINDSLSHEVGDGLLAHVAHTLNNLMRDAVSSLCPQASCMVARLGGDEFTILLRNMRDEATVRRIADAILRRIAEPVQIEGFSLCTGASIGICFCEGPNLALSDLLRDADAAMYQAKWAGRGRYAIFDAEMHKQLLDRLSLEQDLRAAVGAEQLELFYQPIVNIDTGRLEAVEALMRWRHPKLGMVSPGQFIPLAEESELILQLGSWALRSASEFARRIDAIWRHSGPTPRVCVNISKRQLAWQGFLEDVRRMLSEGLIAPRLLEFEITESTIMHDLKQMAPVLKEVRAMGIKLSVDDFGTGYSSLSMLPQFPLNAVKIDRAFIQKLGVGTGETAIVNAVVTLAHHLGLSVVGEGVETAEQLVQLQSIGCCFAQGYLLGRPSAGQDILARLMNGGESWLPQALTQAA